MTELKTGKIFHYSNRTNGISSLQFDNNGDLLVSNYAHPREPNLFHSYTFGMYRYDLSADNWYSLGDIPIVGDKYVVHAISTHPTNNLIKFAGTNHAGYSKVMMGE